MSYSDKLATLYDSLMEGYEFILHPTQKLVYEFTSGKKELDLLELGCGTGTILKAFPKYFNLYGLDISPGMLAIARKKVKRATFFEADMSNFHLQKRFDVIICTFDSINHLLQFTLWENTFKLVSQHLKKGGIFVFDMNTVKRHQSLVKLPAYIKRQKNQIIVFKLLKDRGNRYADRTQIFTLKRGKIILFEENIYEASFPTNKVIKAIKKYFSIEKIFDAHREYVTKDTGRIFFVCKKNTTTIF